MPFIVKATYRNETRKFTFTESVFPTYQELYHQLYRVFAVGHSYYLSKLLFSPQEGTKLLIGTEAHSAADYDIYIAPFKGHVYPNGRLTFSVYDETPHKIPTSGAPGSFIHPIPPVPPMPFFGPPPTPPAQPQQYIWPSNETNTGLSSHTPMDVSEATTKAASTSTECCSVAEGKKEVKSLMDNFLHDFTRIMNSTFGEDRSFIDPMGSPHSATPRAPTPVLHALDLEASLLIPGSFIQPRPHSPDIMEDDIEKSQTPPQLEPLQTLHPNIWCDFCGKQIRGLRFKCQECAGYDLCANCIVVNQALDKHNADQMWIHRFSTISPPTSEDAEPRQPIFPQPQRGSSSPPSSPGPVVHINITCDMCDETVIGSRHKCLDCPDYDLCDRCIGNAPTQHPRHKFLKLNTPGRVIIHTVDAPPLPPLPPLPHNARCNLCDSRIIGERYKCTGCPDFDTCAACFTITPEQHPTHVFVRVSRPQDMMSSPSPDEVYHFATCDGCDKNIVGVRYKCMHAGCPDFDLCQNCEALPIPVHPSTHPFLKIRDADTLIPVVPRNVPRRAASPVVEHVVPVAEALAHATPRERTPVLAAPPTPPVSTPVERLHAIRMQAERRLSARMQQLQSYPFQDGTNSNPDVDPAIEERLIRERKEAEEKALALDKELEERENARRKKHEDALKRQSEEQPSIQFESPTQLDSLTTTLRQFANLDLGALNALIKPSEAPTQTKLSSPTFPVDPVAQANKYPALPEVTARMPEMIQRKTSFFGSPFIHPLESPLQATFISDNNIPDGHIFPAGAEYVKSWCVRNDGTEVWSEGTELVFVGGMRLGAFEGAPTTYEVGKVFPGQEVDVCAGDMKAPETSGRYVSHWRLRDPQGRQFGPRMWCDIEVLELESDHSQHSSLVNSTIVMPNTAPEQASSVAELPSSPASPVTLPSSTLTSQEVLSDSSSAGSVSLVDHSESDWDEFQDAPSPRREPPGRVDDAEYLVLYDSSDSASDEA